MNKLLVAAAIVLIPCAAYAQSTVGDVPSDPNKMPASNGSAAPSVTADQMAASDQAQRSAGQPSSVAVKSRGHRRHKVKKVAEPQPQ